MDDLADLATRVAVLRRALADAERRSRAGEPVALYALAALLDDAARAERAGLNRNRHALGVISHHAARSGESSKP